MNIGIDKINQFIFTKHNIVPGTQINNIAEISRNHLGLHSARISTPYTTLCSRTLEYNPQMLMKELYSKKNLIKMRCMRKTLHIVPFDIAPIVHMSTLDMRMAECKLFFNRNNISLLEVEDLQENLLSFISAPMTSFEIENKIKTILKISNDKLKIVSAKMVLKYFWEKGVLCYINSTDDWEKESRKYAVSKNFYGAINLNLYEVDEAQELLILQYISKFGPVTLKDISWWSGLSLRIIKTIVDNNKNTIQKEIFKDCPKEYYITKIDCEELYGFKNIDFEWISLLAYEDPSLKGYYESRFRYVDHNHYNLLFNQIGEVRASVILDGKAIGVWTWDKKRKKISIELFNTLRPDIVKKINRMKEEYESILYPSQQITFLGL